MKITQLLEGRVKELVTSRHEDARLRDDPSLPTSYTLEFSFEGEVYQVTTMAKTPRQAVSNALFRVNKYIKSNYPQYRGQMLSRSFFDIREVNSPEEGSRRAIKL